MVGGMFLYGCDHHSSALSHMYQIVIFEYENVEIQLRQLLVTIQSTSLAKRIHSSSRISKLGYLACMY